MRSWSTAMLMLVSTMLPHLGGCGDGSKSLSSSVTGTVFINGKPASGVILEFCPLKGTQGQGGEGYSNENGRYELKSPTGENGVAPGDYRVTCAKLVMPDGSDFSPANVLPPQQVLPSRYSDIGKTLLLATVLPDGGEIDFDLEVPKQ